MLKSYSNIFVKMTVSLCYDSLTIKNPFFVINYFCFRLSFYVHQTQFT